MFWTEEAELWVLNGEGFLELHGANALHGLTLYYSRDAGTRAAAATPGGLEEEEEEERDVIAAVELI